MAMTPPMTPASKITSKIPVPKMWKSDSPLAGKNMSFKPVNALGNRATMPMVMTSETPLPMPRSVICSPSHISIIVPVVMISTVRKKYIKWLSISTSWPVKPWKVPADSASCSQNTSPGRRIMESSDSVRIG